MPASDLVTPSPEASPATAPREEAPAVASDETPDDETPADADVRHGAPAAPPRPSPEARREVIATLAIVGTILGLALARPLVRRLERRPPVAQCTAMLAHYAEEQARAVSLARASSAVEGTRTQKAEAPSVNAAERCSRELTAEEVDCAVHAGNVDEIERCLPLP
jgi:hypothetical protein